MNTYITALPDYYERAYTFQSYQGVFERIANADAGRTLCLSEDGLDTAGKVYTFWQKVRGWFGFCDLSDETQVGGEFLKFLFYGATHGFISQPQILEAIQTIDAKCQRNELHLCQSLREVFQQLSQFHDRLQREQEALTNYLRDKLEAYYHTHKEALQPSFWDSFSAQTVNVPYVHKFGDTYLSLAEQNLYTGLDEGSIHDALCYYNLSAQLYNSPEQDYFDRLRTSFDNFVYRIQHPSQTLKEQIARIYLLLGQRAHQNQQYRWASIYFAKASTFDLRLSIVEPHHQMLWMDAQLQNKDYKSVEALIDAIDGDQLSNPLKQRYVDACIEIGDHYFGKRSTVTTTVFRALSFGSTPSSEDHCRKSIEYYNKALAITDLKKQKVLLQRMLDAIKHIPTNDELRNEYFDLGYRLLTSEQWETAAHFFLISMQYESFNALFSSNVGKESIVHFTSAMNLICQNQLDAKSLKLIDQAIQCIGDIKAHLETLQAWNLFSVKPVQILNENEEFLFDVGAWLHFLRAEILFQLNHAPKEILMDYMLATQLAPRNPFGSKALFLKGNDLTPGDDVGTLINVYRTLAIDWAAPANKTMKLLSKDAFEAKLRQRHLIPEEVIQNA